MADEPTYEVTESAIPNIDDEEPKSFMDRMRRQRKAVADEEFHDLDLPGYHGELFCRYRLLDSTELNEINRKVRARIRNRNEQILAITLDNLIEACDEIWARDNGREMPLREHEDFQGNRDMPVKYDLAFAQFLNFASELGDSPSARGVLLAVFGGNDIAVQAHGAQLARWMMKMGTEVDELLGEV